MAKDLTIPISGITKDKFQIRSIHIDTEDKYIMAVFSVGYNEYLEWQNFALDPSGHIIYTEFSGGSGASGTHEVCGSSALSGWYELTSTASANVYRPQDHHNTKITNSYIMTNNVIISSDADDNMPVADPYTVIAGRMNTGNWSPESSMKDFMEWVLTNYAEV